LDHKSQENNRLKNLLRRLLEAETGEDSMICHDGGFRYSGDFMSMESETIEPVSIMTLDERRELFDRGYIELSTGEGSTAVCVTEAGRTFTFGDRTTM
jgi:hypothetical protein